jgi:hypothetical protein
MHYSHLSPAESLTSEPIQRSTIVAGSAPRPNVRGSSSAQLDVLSVPPCILPLKACRVLLYSPAADTFVGCATVTLSTQVHFPVLVRFFVWLIPSKSHGPIKASPWDIEICLQKEMTVKDSERSRSDKQHPRYKLNRKKTAALFC